MAGKCIPLLLLIAWAPLGCGGLSQEDLRQYSYKRPKDNDDEKPAAPAANAAPANTNPNPVDANVAVAPPTGDTQTPATTASPSNPSSSDTAASTAPDPPANTAEASVTVASAESTGVSASNPLDGPTPANLGNTISSTESTPSTSEDDEQPPVTNEDSTPAELQAARDWHFKRKLREQAKQDAAERAAEEAAKNQRVARPVSSDGDSNFISTNNNGNNTNLYDDFRSLQALFDRLTNPENLSPEELSHVAQQLAYDDATKESLAYYYGWILTTDKVEELRTHMAWSPALQRPMAAIHWGLGLEYTGDPKLLAHPDPIGSHGSIFQNASRRHSSSKMQGFVGELGDRVLFGLDENFAAGAYGDLLKPPAEERLGQQEIALKWQATPTGFSPETMGRGITLLKGGTRKELLYISRVIGIDVLVLYEMTLREPKSRTGPIVNITKLTLVDVARNKDLFSTAPLNNIKIRIARQDRTSKDLVEKEFDELFAFADESIKLGPIPSGLNEENAKARIETLAASQPDNPLPAMAEMRLYQAKGLVGDATLYAGYRALIGDGPAKKLITGTPSERVTAISRFLPKVEKRTE